MEKKKDLENFCLYLKREEKSPATIEKYVRDVQKFQTYMEKRTLTKEEVLAYKIHLIKNYAPSSANSMLAALNTFLRFQNREDCCVRNLKIQRKIFRAVEKELSAIDYQRLLEAADDRLRLILQTICFTGIRVSELKYITAEAVQEGKAAVTCKNKLRVVYIPVQLQKLLKDYMQKQVITKGEVFVTKGGKPLDRSNLWRRMKKLGRRAGIPETKIYPHNLRHLFARTFYAMDKDIVSLAGLLGHNSIETTRIYIMETEKQHRSNLERICEKITT